MKPEPGDGGYAVLDHSRLFRTAKDDLPGLIVELEQIVKKLERGLK